MSVNMKDWISVLMVHLMRCPRTITRALDKVLPKDIAQLAGPDVAYLWHCSQEYFRQHQKPIPLPFVEAKLSDRIRINQLNETAVSSLVDFLAYIYNVQPSDFEPEEASGLIKRLLQETRVSFPLSQLVQTGAGMDEVFASMQTGMMEASVGMASAIDPIACLYEQMDTICPVPIGGPEIEYFNLLCNGGLRPGEVVVLIGPQGGFKTTAAIDITCSMAKMHEHSAFMAYEQSAMAGDLPVRFSCRLTGISKKRLEARDFKAQRTVEEIQKLKDAQQYSQYIKWFDRSMRMDRTSDIASQIQELVHFGCKPKLVVIDQLLTWVQRWPECKGDESKIRFACTRALEEVKHHVAEALGTSVLVLHQMTDALIGRDASFKPKACDSAEVKGIGRWVDFVINFGTMDKVSKCLYMIANKTRRGEKLELVVEADGDKSRLRRRSDMTWYSVNGVNQFVEVGNENRLISDSYTPSRARPADHAES